MSKVAIYRKIGRRIVRLLVDKSAAKTLKNARKKSAMLRNILKKKAAARTSLAEKRISAIRDVAAVKRLKAGTGQIKILGSGRNLHTVQSPISKSVVKLNAAGTDYERKFAISDEMRYRAKIKAILSKKKLAPETFLVETSTNKYLVQDRITPASDVLPKRLSFDTNPRKVAAASHAKRNKALEVLNKRRNKSIKRAGKLGIMTGDAVPENLGAGKRTKFIDSGLFGTQTKVIKAFKKRIEQFTIKKKGTDF